MQSLQIQFTTIGNQLTGCCENCDGIDRDQTHGVLPRCLFFEDREGERGCAVVGLNPGRASDDEVTFYIENGSSYDATRKWWNDVTRFRHRYYTRIADMLVEVGVSGPILWTELVKCQSKAELRELPLATLRNCVRRYLQDEIGRLPETWPLFAVGREAYRVSAYIFPSRTVIGVPHPTGSYGLFPKQVVKNASNQIRDMIEKPPGQVGWIKFKEFKE